jgi:hypothetical protein
VHFGAQRNLSRSEWALSPPRMEGYLCTSFTHPINEMGRPKYMQAYVRINGSFLCSGSGHAWFAYSQVRYCCCVLLAPDSLAKDHRGRFVEQFANTRQYCWDRNACIRIRLDANPGSAVRTLTFPLQFPKKIQVCSAQAMSACGVFQHRSAMSD